MHSQSIHRIRDVAAREWDALFDEGYPFARHAFLRALEDSGTMTSPLVPWNTCGAYMASVLGVPTMAYLPFAFINLLTPILTVFYGFTRITFDTLSEEEAEARLALDP